MFKVNKKSTGKHKPSSWMESLKEITREYIEISSIHGLTYIQEPKANLFIKLFWILILLTSFGCCNYIVFSFWVRYKSTPTKMRMASNHIPLPTLQIPAITFCHINRINEARAKAMIDTLILPSNVTKETILRGIYQTPGFVDFIDYNETDLEIMQEVLFNNRYDVGRTMSFLQQPCDELFVRCRWQDTMYPCNELLKPSTAYHGSCCTFNKNGEFATAKFIDVRGGLSLALSPQIDRTKSSVYSDGIKVLVHEANVFASKTSFEKMISHKAETLMRLKAETTTCSEEVKQLPIEERKCLYESERRLRFFKNYREASCNLECVLLRILEVCECLPYYFETLERIPVCTFKQIKCLVDNFTQIHSSSLDLTRICQCPSNCNDFIYDGVTTKLYLYPHNFSMDPLYDGLNRSHMVIHITFGKQVFRSLRKDLMTNILSLAANLGGVYSLFIGFSALTFFEIFYYYSVRLFARHSEFSKKIEGRNNLNGRNINSKYVGGETILNLVPGHRRNLMGISRRRSITHE